MKLIVVVDVTAQECGFTWVCEMKTQTRLKNEFSLSWLQSGSILRGEHFPFAQGFFCCSPIYTLANGFPYFQNNLINFQMNNAKCKFSIKGVLYCDFSGVPTTKFCIGFKPFSKHLRFTHFKQKGAGTKGRSKARC